MHPDRGICHAARFLTVLLVCVIGLTGCGYGVKGHADALYVSPDSLTATNSIRIGALALKAQLPTMHGVREFVEDGGLMSYGPNLTDLFRRAGDYVDKILRGTKPVELPVEQPTKFELVVNLITAMALGLEVPATLLARADEVIE